MKNLQNYYKLFIGTNDGVTGKPLNFAKCKKEIIKIVGYYVGGFTISKAIGYWQGVEEVSIIVEIINELNLDFLIESIKKEICKKLHQNCILSIKNAVFAEF